MASSSGYSNPPCAACKFLRRKCLPGCTFAPYFPPDHPTKFFNVHKIFGASNVSKLLSEIPSHQREDAVNSLAYEAAARLKDPVYGCVGAISALQRQVIRLQKELDATNADIMRYASSGNEMMIPYSAAVNVVLRDQQQRNVEYGSGYTDPNSWFLGPCSYPWGATAGSSGERENTGGDGSG